MRRLNWSSRRLAAYDVQMRVLPARPVLGSPYGDSGHQPQRHQRSRIPIQINLEGTGL